MTSHPRLRRRVAVAVATVTGNAFLVFGSILFGSLATLTGWWPSRRGTPIFIWTTLWSRGLLRASGVRVEVETEVDLDRDQGYVFMVNHQSMFDIPLLLATLPVPARFMAKRELFRIPVFGWGLKAGGFIPVDRDQRSRGRDAFQGAMRRLQRGASILLFPEETRSVDGDLLPFRRGGFLLALKCGLPVVPVGIHGTLEVQPRGSFRIHPHRVRVRYGAPVAPAEYGVKELPRFVAEVRDRIAELAGVGAGEPAATTAAARQPSSGPA
jgi:1-acyl-sn-glycerol-3-phosphate acyltransferase